MKPKVSVIMGIYNCADTLSEAINSLINQTFKDWELIMCDDGSSDRTLEVALMYANKYDNIKVYKNEKNMGLNYTLNHCLKYAQGEYIARMDGDDISLSDRFKREVDFLDQHSEYAIVSTPMVYFDDKGDFGVGKQSGEPNVKAFPKGTPFAHAASMVRKEAYDRVEGYTVVNEYLRVEDWHLWIKMYSKGYKGYNLSEHLYKMRDDRNATNRRKFKYRLNEMRVSAFAVKELGLSCWNYIYVLRSLIIGLIPKSLYEALHKKKIETK